MDGSLSGSFLYPWNSPGKNTGVGCRSLLQEIFRTQGSNPGLLHCGLILYRLKHKGKQISGQSGLAVVFPSFLILVPLSVRVYTFIFVVVLQLLSCVQLFTTLWMQRVRLPCPSLSPRVCSNSCPLSRWCQPTISSSVAPSPPALNLTQHWGLFLWIGSLHQVAKVLELKIQHLSSNEYLGLISFRTDWLDLFAVQGILTSLLQHHSSKASILRCSAFLVQPLWKTVWKFLKKIKNRASLVVQWLGVHITMQGHKFSPWSG